MWFWRLKLLQRNECVSIILLFPCPVYVGCPHLAGYKKEVGEGWHLLSHISHVDIHAYNFIRGRVLTTCGSMPASGGSIPVNLFYHKIHVEGHSSFDSLSVDTGLVLINGVIRHAQADYRSPNKLHHHVRMWSVLCFYQICHSNLCTVWAWDT